MNQWDLSTKVTWIPTSWRRLAAPKQLTRKGAIKMREKKRISCRKLRRLKLILWADWTPKTTLYRMVIVVFLVDTSGSMNQRTSIGTTLLDVAKNAVENFIKVQRLDFLALRAWINLPLTHICDKIPSIQLRQRDPSHRSDRYMLVTFDESPGAVKVRWDID